MTKLPPYITLPSWTEDDRAAALARIAAEDAAALDASRLKAAAATLAKNRLPRSLDEERRAQMHAEIMQSHADAGFLPPWHRRQ